MHVLICVHRQDDPDITGGVEPSAIYNTGGIQAVIIDMEIGVHSFPSMKCGGRGYGTATFLYEGLLL